MQCNGKEEIWDGIKTMLNVWVGAGWESDRRGRGAMWDREDRNA